ncbi:hypothetical protein XELAEV_18026955mg [Xenopus laevis]|uniref:Uncharacterized protein n=1 Tax=Xenopus laevis TaxID=8355 RepID=A0A974CUP4_XENLA|nr:hypothetical protein XELAEV_18026955mg [Xenopus laevis]
MPALPLLYLFHTLPTYSPKGLIDTMQKAFNKFVWNGKMARLNFTTACHSCYKGGLALNNTIVAHSMKAWSQKKDVYHLYSPHNPATSLLNNEDFPPGKISRAFSWWEQSQLTTIYSLIQTNCYCFHKYKIHIQETYKTPQGEWLRY